MRNKHNTAVSGFLVVAAVAVALIASVAVERPAHAGGFIFAGENNGVDLITHPQGYTGTQNTLNLSVCIDSTLSSVPAGASSLADLEQPVRNMVAIWNQLQPTVGNTLLFSNNNIPDTPVLYDWESVALHELGHCIGLAHPNAATESGLPSSQSSYTKATDGVIDGPDNPTAAFNLSPGTDGVIGTSDDVRGNDDNLHWFRTDTNDPGQLPLPVPVDASTYARDLSSLPVGDNFAANLDRAVAGTLGYPNTSTLRTEAVMQQGSFNDEDQRRLTADGVATILLGQSGLDETAGTADDYVINLSYGGIQANPTGCNIDIRITGGSFAFCSTGGFFIGTNHVRISTAYMQFGPSVVTYYFNQDGPCRQTIDLVTGQWKQIALSCSPPAGSDTVADLFGDDLSGTYGVNWIVYERDAANNVYVQLALTDTMEVGRGYWIKTNMASQTVNIEEDFNGDADIPLEDSATGRFNMVGHRYWYDEAWDDVRVIDGASVLTLDQADPLDACQGMNPVANGCIMSRVAYKWNGAAYESFDGQTMGMEGTLENFDGFWVKAFKSGISLRIPDQKSMPVDPNSELLPASETASRAAVETQGPGPAQDGWYIRLIAESGDLRDAGNVLGQLADSRRGYDAHDLGELTPFGDDYLTVVFPHQNWGEQSGDYTSDFHRLRPGVDRWGFEVWSSDPTAEVTLSWEGPRELLERAQLRDEETGERIRVQPGGSYTFTMTDIGRGFKWVVKNTIR